jgi:hypothetical protein
VAGWWQVGYYPPATTLYSDGVRQIARGISPDKAPAWWQPQGCGELERVPAVEVVDRLHGILAVRRGAHDERPAVIL